MAVSFEENPTPESPALVTGSSSTVYLRSREPAVNNGEEQTVEVWEGTTEAIREAFNERKSNGLVQSISIDQSGAKSSLNITYTQAFTSGEPDENSESGWSASFLEVPTPLAAHPYFQVAYVAGSGELIEDEIARADSAIKRGREYVASGVYKEWVKRYYGLRIAGVEEWTQYGVEITHSYTTDQQAVATASTDNVGVVVAINDIGMPGPLKTVVENIPRIAFPNDPDNPNPDPGAQQLERAALEYIGRAPDVAVTIDNDGKAKFTITERWWGLAKWSAVIYKGGTWDPQGQSEA